MGHLALAVSELDRLFAAWRQVRSTTLRSRWPQVRREAEAFDATPLARLSELQVALRRGDFEFAPKHGYAKRKSGGSRRGITVHSISDRIVQRSILSVFFARESRLRDRLGALPGILEHPASFAGNPGRGVPEAVARVAEALRHGSRAFAYSDMKDFFPRIERSDVVELVRSETGEEEFAELFRRALQTELSNPGDLRDFLDLFPGPERGVAQGSLLSVLAGNLVLRNFDRRFSETGVVLVRYLDDFALLTESVSAAQQWFAIAQEELERVGMTCYSPGDGSHKAGLGRVTEGWDFLGCRIHPDGISPSRRNSRRLLRDLRAMIQRAQATILEFQADPTKRRAIESTYAQTLVQLDRRIRGWGAAYRFVSNRVVFSQLDVAIDRLVADFQGWFGRVLAGESPRVRRRSLGIMLLADNPPRDVTG